MAGQILMRAMVRILCVLLAVFVAGCGRQVSGHAVTAHPPLPPPPPEGAYASTLNKKERQQLTYNAEIRAVDPCGYVDVESVNKVGVLRNFSAMKSQRDCELTVVVDRDTNRSLEINIGIIPNKSTYEQDSRTITVAGTRIVENTDKWPGRPANPGFNTCHDLLPFSDQSVLHVAVKRSTDDAPCDQTHVIVAGMLPRLVERPQRKDSKWHAYHAISVRDPCDALVTLGAGHSVGISGVFSPWRCYFTLDDNSKDGLYMLQMDWCPVSAFANPSRGDERTQIAGYPALARRVAERCTVEVAVPDPPGVKYDPIYDPATATSSLSTNAANCDLAEAAVTAAVRAFLN